MIGALYSGISGMSAHQQRMDVIANDIANVNTVGYRQSEVTFKEALVNTLTTPAVGTPGRQEGLGVQMGLVTRDFSFGALTESGLSTQMAIQGDGFFAVQATDAAGGAIGKRYYTRAGDFTMDVKDAATANLITTDGQALLGADGLPLNLRAGMPAGVDLVSFAIAQDGTVTTVGSDGTSYAAGMIPVVRFQNNSGLMAVGSNLYEWTTAASPTAPVLGGTANPENVSVLQGYLESSNVDLTREFTDMIVTQRGFQASSKTITTADEMLQVILGLRR